MSLPSELARRLMHDMILKAKGDSLAVVLVVDPHTARILSSCLRMYDVMEAGVIVLQNVLLKRERLDLPAIYFIDPIDSVLSAVMADFADPKRPQYESAHLFFTTRVKAESMKRLSDVKPLVKRIKSFVELNVDFISNESKIFTFDRFHTVQKLFFPLSQDDLSNELSAHSRHLVSLCLTLNELPHIRFHSAAKNGLPKALATFFEDDLKKTVAKLPQWKANEHRERGTLLIVDRSIDPIAPLMHEYTYQAMSNDLCKIRGELCYLKNSEQKDEKTPTAAAPKSAKDAEVEALVLSEDDDLWVDLRHRHIGEVMHQIAEMFKSFKGQNKLAKLQKDDDASLKDMIQAMKEMPEYKSMMKKYTKHMALAQECKGKFDANHLKDLGELEQDMATGLTEDGKAVQPKTIKTSLLKMCQNPAISVLDKLRLLMIYIISQGGIQDATRKELMKDIHTALQKCIRNLEKLGVELNAAQRPKHSKDRLAEFAKRSKTIPLALMRYLPSLHSLLESLVTNALSEEDFPYTSPPPPTEKPSKEKGTSARKRQGDWKSDKKEKDGGKDDGGEEDTRPRFIVFVLGGITFSEMRSCYEIGESQRCNLYMGAASTITAKSFIKDLSELSNVEFKDAIKSSGQTDDDDDDDDDEAQGTIDVDEINKLAIQFDNKK